jgi:predicted phage tail protein
MCRDLMQLKKRWQLSSDVLEGLPITRTISDTNIDAARITINVPLLQTVQDNGDILGAEINLQIAVQYNSGGFTTVIDDTIKGRTSDLYQRDYIITGIIRWCCIPH